MASKKCMCGATDLFNKDPDLYPGTGNSHGTLGCNIVSAAFAHKGSRTCGVYAKEERSTAHYTKVIDLDELRHDIRCAIDRTASKAHAEREPWHAGIDPDEP